MGAKWKESTRKSYRKQVRAIGANVLAIRKIRGMSKADVAREAGLSDATVARVEEGKQPVCKPTLDKLCDWVSRYQGIDQNSSSGDSGLIPPRRARRDQESGNGSIQVVIQHPDQLYVAHGPIQSRGDIHGRIIVFYL